LIKQCGAVLLSLPSDIPAQLPSVPEEPPVTSRRPKSVGLPLSGSSVKSVERKNTPPPVKKESNHAPDSPNGMKSRKSPLFMLFSSSSSTSSSPTLSTTPSSPTSVPARNSPTSTSSPNLLSFTPLSFSSSPPTSSAPVPVSYNRRPALSLSARESIRPPKSPPLHQRAGSVSVPSSPVLSPVPSPYRPSTPDTNAVVNILVHALLEYRHNPQLEETCDRHPQEPPVRHPQEPPVRHPQEPPKLMLDSPV